jgi:hypothetical protein
MWQLMIRPGFFIVYFRPFDSPGQPCGLAIPGNVGCGRSATYSMMLESWDKNEGMLEGRKRIFSPTPSESYLC